MVGDGCGIADRGEHIARPLVFDQRWTAVENQQDRRRPTHRMVGNRQVMAGLAGIRQGARQALQDAPKEGGDPTAMSASKFPMQEISSSSPNE